LDPPFGEWLKVAPWPGNVRQLEHVLRRLTVLANGADPETMIHIAREILANEGLLPDPEREKLLAVLKANDWNQRQAARELGVSEGALRYKMKCLNIERPHNT